MKRRILSMLLALCLVLSLLPAAVLASDTADENYVTLALTYGDNVSAEDKSAAEALYTDVQYATCKAANEAYMALFGVGWQDRTDGDAYLTVTDTDAPLYKYAGTAGSVTEVRYYIHGTLAGFTSLQSDGNQIDCTVGGNHQIFRTSYSIIGVDGDDGSQAQLTDGNVQAYVAGGYASSFNPSGKLTIDNIDFTSTTSTTVGASAARNSADAVVTSAEMEIKGCTFHGRLYVYDNFENEGKMTYNIHDNVFDGTAYSGDSNAYAIFAQCRGGNELRIQNNEISGYARGINIDHANIHAVVSGNEISVTDPGRACIQLSSLTSAEIEDNTLALTGGNAVTLHSKLLTMSKAPEITIAENEITGYGYFLYDDAAASNKAFTADKLTLHCTNNTITPDADKTISTTHGVKDGKVYGISGAVSLTVNGPCASIGTQGYASLDAAIQAVTDGEVITITADGEYKLNGGLSYAGKGFTIRAGDGVDVSFDMSAATALHDAKIRFEGVTFNYKTNGNYIGIQHANTLVYDRCQINGMAFLYAASETFNDCTFTQTSKDAYNVWTYGAKAVAFNRCRFVCEGKSVLVYNEGANPSTDLTVTDTTFTAKQPAAGKAAIEIGYMKGASSVTVDSATKAEGFAPGSVSGSTLWNDKEHSSDQKPNTNITVTVADTVVHEPTVAKVGGTSYSSLTAAFAALNSTNYTLELIDSTAWDAATPVYWQAGGQSGYTATLAAALTAGYKEDAGHITIICRPGADVGTLTHGHVADDLTIYGSNAYISGGECDLEVDTFPFSRATGKQVQNGTDDDYLAGDIAITAYELDNLGVWGQRHTAHTIRIALTDCDGKDLGKANVQRVYISGETGPNNITLTGCDFLTATTAVYSNADGAITLDGCSFTGGQAPVNLNHKADGAQTVTVSGCTLTNCGDDGAWKTFAAPIRFVNSGSGTMDTTVTDTTFSGTKGQNGDILLGDGRDGKDSGDVTLRVTPKSGDTQDIHVQAQRPGYYDNAGNTAPEHKAETLVSASDAGLTTSLTTMLPNAARIGSTEYATLREALEALTASTDEAVTIELLQDQDVSGFTVDLSGSAIKNLTISGGGKILDSGVHGVGIDGPVYCPVIRAKLPAGGTFTVDNITAPGCLLFDTSSDASLIVKNSTFLEAQSGYPSAKEITYQGNIFSFRGDLDDYYTNNAYPVWYKTEQSTRSISFLDNTVTGPRGFHIETRSTDADKSVDITVTGNRFTLRDDDYPNKTIALQLVRNLNGTITFTNNHVDAYMGVCFFKDITPQNDPQLIITNNYTTGKLYGSSEWNHSGATDADKIAAADEFAKSIVEGCESSDNGSNITPGHTHDFVNGSCSICGQVQSGTSHVGSSGSRTPAEPEDARLFTDVPTNAYYADAVAWATENGVTNGVGGGRFGAALPCTRAQIVTFLWRAAGSPAATGTVRFTDLAPDAYYAEAVRWAVSAGITTGTSDTTFSPDSACTRAQAVTLLYRALGAKAAVASQFSDVPAESFFAEAVAWAAENGVTDGVGGGRFAPHEPCTRAQIVTFLYRAYQNH